VLNLPTVELLEKVLVCGNSSGRAVDKFAIGGLTSSAASAVWVPR
jgi:flavin reductase (DIM6/NTAB) family NADH-FMN oxidoreductase RutF